MAIDPITASDETAWTTVSRILSEEGFKAAAVALAHHYLDLCYKLQTDLSTRVYKAEIFSWLSKLLREVGELQLAKGWMLLAFLEDLYANHDTQLSTAYESLLQSFEMPQEKLDSLANFAKELEDRPLFPEEVLVQWELFNAPELSLLYPRR